VELEMRIKRAFHVAFVLAGMAAGCALDESNDCVPFVDAPTPESAASSPGTEAKAAPVAVP